MDQHPLAFAWDCIDKTLRERAPENTFLSREEFIRIFHSCFYVGAAEMLRGFCALASETPPEKLDASLIDLWTEVNAAHLENTEFMNLAQIVNTLQAQEVKN